MSKTKDHAPKVDKAEKKRKRQEEGDDVPKKSKKSRKSEVDQDAPAADAPVVEEPKLDKKAEKEEKKKRKKERKEKEAAEAGGENGDNGDVKESADFVPLDNDVPMPDATHDKKKEKKDKKEKKEKKDKKDKKEKKSKKSKDTPEADSADEQNGVAEEDAPAAEAEVKLSKEEKKKAKKEKKEKKENKSKKDDDATAETNGDAPADEESAEVGAEEDGDDAAEPGKKGRFIVFVGNLPYSATKESISEHFAKLHPTDIRLRTYKGTEKFMGTCFVEFDRFDRMETCLKKYHHSVFPDGKKKEGRKINVELSAGGGGNSEGRKSKIVAKNDKLHDERARDREKRAELEMKQSERKEKKEAKGNKADDVEEAEPDNGGIHPARLAMMAAPARPMHRQRY